MSSLLTVSPCCLVCVEMCMPVIGSPIFLLLCFSSPPPPPPFSPVSFSHMMAEESKESDNLVRPFVLDHCCSGTRENKLNSSGSTDCNRNEPPEYICKVSPVGIFSHLFCKQIKLPMGCICSAVWTLLWVAICRGISQRSPAFPELWLAEASPFTNNFPTLPALTNSPLPHKHRISLSFKGSRVP